MVSHFGTLDNYTSFPIPLEKLCSLEVRELLEQGTPEGSGHNQSAIKVLKDLIGVEKYCQVSGIPYEGTARQYYESFLLASGIDSDSTTESRWKSAIAANPSPSLSPDKIQTCLDSWNRQHGQTGGQRINLTRPQAPKKSKQAAKLPPIEGTVTLAKFDKSPTDAPQATKPATLPKGVPDTATVKTYRYSRTQFVKRFDWEDKTKHKGRDKTFRQCHVNPLGELTWEKGNDPWPAYREPEAIAAKDWILFVEGEECVETARRLGLVAITFQGSNWSETAIAPALTRLKEAGCHGIAILPDHDRTGEEKGQKLLTVATKIGLPALIVPMIYLHPECPEKGDIADWMKWGQSMGMTQDDFIRRLEAEIHAAVNRRQLSQESEPVADKHGSPVEQARVAIKQWLLEDDPVAKALTRANLCRVLGVDRKTFDALAVSLDENGDKPKAKVYSPDEFMALPTGGSLLLAPGIAGNGVTIKAGPSGVGKTTLAYDLAGAVIMQDEFLGELPTRQGSVLFVSSDEPHAFAQDKLINRGITHGYKMMIDWDVSQWSDLEMTVEDMRPALVIVDSFNAIHNDPGFDENSAQASQTIKKLERLSVKYGVPIVLIHHTSKNKENRGVHKLRGSTAIAASCSSVLLLETIEGTTKALTQPKIRGSEPLNVIVEMDVESGRFKVTEGNVADNETKSLAQRLKDFFTVNPGRFFEMAEIKGQFPGQDRKVLTNALNRLVNQGHIIKRPSKINPRFKVYGTERTSESESSPHTPLSHSYSCVKNDDSNPETIATQELEDVTIMSPSMSPSCHHHVTMKNDDNSVMTTETVENKGFEAPCHHVTIGSPLEGERVPTPNDEQGCVLGNENEDYPDFKQGDRVQHPNYGPGTIEIVSDEVYCQWDELGGTMRLIQEDFQVMTEIP